MLILSAGGLYAEQDFRYTVEKGKANFTGYSGNARTLVIRYYSQLAAVRGRFIYRKQENTTHLFNFQQINIRYFLPGLYHTTDNLRLRGEEGTIGKALFTLPEDTAVKIIAVGTAETIDGITAIWVQIKVEKDTVSIQGETIKTGTIGWYFAGYLARQ